MTKIEEAIALVRSAAQRRTDMEAELTFAEHLLSACEEQLPPHSTEAEDLKLVLLPILRARNMCGPLKDRIEDAQHAYAAVFAHREKPSAEPVQPVVQADDPAFWGLKRKELAHAG
jgi:uracil phosphoribosyltransferase